MDKKRKMEGQGGGEAQGVADQKKDGHLDELSAADGNVGHPPIVDGHVRHLLKSVVSVFVERTSTLEYTRQPHHTPKNGNGRQ
jgi:hypothetical protein